MARKAQGSLEYLIMITAVLAIAAIVVLYVTGAFGTQSSTISIAACKHSAAECRLLRAASLNDPCNICDDSCINSVSGEEVTNGSVNCCKQGLVQLIYDGSPGCDGTSSPTCSDGTLYGECSITKPKYCDQGTLIDDCVTCFPCPTGQDCNAQTGSCYTPAPQPVCGNGVKETGEACDSDSVDCETLGEYRSGTDAPCLGDCSGYDTSVCIQLEWFNETVDSLSNTGIDSSIKLDPNDIPNIAYVSIGNTLKYTKKIGGSWQTEIVDSTSEVWFTSLVLDSNNYPHISYNNKVSLTVTRLHYAKNTGSGWDIEIADPLIGGDVGWVNSITIDSSDHPHISYYNRGASSLKYATYTGTDWHEETLDMTGSSGEYSSIAIDSNDYPHISYDSNQNLRYIRWTGSEWGVNETVDSLGNVGDQNSIAIDSNNNPHISYFDLTNKDLKYAYKDATGWHIEIADSLGEVGWHTSIVLDSNDYPHIAHRKGVPEKDLLYTYKDASGWHTQTVDSIDQVGEYTSIDLDSNDHPHITYYDRTNEDLKYAYYG